MSGSSSLITSNREVLARTQDSSGFFAEAPPARWRGSFPEEALTLVEMLLFLVAFLLLVVRPGAPSSVFAPSSDAWSP